MLATVRTDSRDQVPLTLLRKGGRAAPELLFRRLMRYQHSPPRAAKHSGAVSAQAWS